MIKPQLIIKKDNVKNGGKRDKLPWGETIYCSDIKKILIKRCYLGWSERQGKFQQI